MKIKSKSFSPPRRRRRYSRSPPRRRRYSRSPPRRRRYSRSPPRRRRYSRSPPRRRRYSRSPPRRRSSPFDSPPRRRRYSQPEVEIGLTYKNRLGDTSHSLEKFPYYTRVVELDYKRLLSVDGLQNLSRLTGLNLNHNLLDEIPNINRSLLELDLQYNNIAKLTGLTSMLSLSILNVSRNFITKIQGLDSLSKLTFLNLSYNKITKIEGLDNLKNLEILNLSNNKITIIEGLDNLEYLDELDLSNNNIKLIPDISVIKNLVLFNIENNPLLSQTHIKTLKKAGKIKNIKYIPPPKEATEWMNICRELGTHRLVELRAIAQKVGINIEGKHKLELCKELALHFEKSQSSTTHVSGCVNDDDILGDAFDEMNHDLYIKLDDGFCFSLSDLEGLEDGGFMNPYTRAKLPKKAVELS